MIIRKLTILMKNFPASILNRADMFIHGFKFGFSFKTVGRIFIRGTGRILLGNNVVINSCMEANPIGGATKTILYAKGNGSINIGNNVGISNTAIVALGRITIEDDVLIGGNCKIYDHDFHSLAYEIRMLPGMEGVIPKPVHIKRGAFVGAHSIILKGVTIGQYSIIGAGSVVTKDVPDGEIWEGNPARFIRKIE